MYSITVAYSEDEARLSIAEGSRDVVGYFKLLVSYLTLHASHVSLYFVMETRTYMDLNFFFVSDFTWSTYFCKRKSFTVVVPF